MKPFSLLAGFLLTLCHSLHAQDILKATNGSVITVRTGAILYVGGGINADNGSTINNAGVISIVRAGVGTANLTDNTAAPYSYGTGKFVFTGTGGPQTMTGSIFNDLDIDNAVRHPSELLWGFEKKVMKGFWAWLFKKKLFGLK